jgi:tRNA pseudouridine38-40 synthase
MKDELPAAHPSDESLPRLRTFRLTIAYDGTHYAGWQVQPGQTTLQGTLEAALERITGESLRVTASGRTDAGVHALGQVVSFRSHTQLSPEVLKKALNAELPHDVAVLEAAQAADDFHAIASAVRKRYRYQLYDGPVRNVFLRQFAWQLFTRLDEAAMHRAAQALVGRHDFRSFETSGSERESSVRTVFELSVRRGQGGATERHDGLLAGLVTADGLIVLEVEADGFLYNMVRTIVGTLVEVGQGKRPETWPAEVLAACDRRAAGRTAPPQGLFLVRVDY